MKKNVKKTSIKKNKTIKRFDNGGTILGRDGKPLSKKEIDDTKAKALDKATLMLQARETAKIIHPDINPKLINDSNDKMILDVMKKNSSKPVFHNGQNMIVDMKTYKLIPVKKKGGTISSISKKNVITKKTTVKKAVIKKKK